MKLFSIRLGFITFVFLLVVVVVVCYIIHVDVFFAGTLLFHPFGFIYID